MREKTMSSRRDLIRAVPAAGAALVLAEAAVPDRAAAQVAVPDLNGWHSPSLVEATVTGPNGAVTTRAALNANIKLGALEKSAVEVAPGVWLLSGWGLGHSMAVQATEGWIIVDTGDSTAPPPRCAPSWRRRRAARSRSRRSSSRIGTMPTARPPGWTRGRRSGGMNGWMPTAMPRPGSASRAASIRRGRWRSSACCTPPKGRTPSPTRWVSRWTSSWAHQAISRRPRLFTHGKVQTFTIAGEEVEVAPNRSDTSDSVGFYFPARRTWITNFMVPGGFIFNIYTLRGGPFRNPLPWLEDNRWIEQKMPRCCWTCTRRR